MLRKLHKAAVAAGGEDVFLAAAMELEEGDSSFVIKRCARIAGYGLQGDLGPAVGGLSVGTGALYGARRLLLVDGGEVGCALRWLHGACTHFELPWSPLAVISKSAAANMTPDHAAACVQLHFSGPAGSFCKHRAPLALRP